MKPLRQIDSPAEDAWSEHVGCGGYVGVWRVCGCVGVRVWRGCECVEEKGIQY